MYHTVATMRSNTPTREPMSAGMSTLTARFDDEVVLRSVDDEAVGSIVTVTKVVGPKLGSVTV